MPYQSKSCSLVARFALILSLLFLHSPAIGEVPAPPLDQFTFYIPEEKHPDLEAGSVVTVPTLRKTQEEIKVEANGVNFSDIVKEMVSQTGRGMAVHRDAARPVTVSIPRGRWTDVLTQLLQETGNIATDYKEVLLIYPDPNASSGLLPLLLLVLSLVIAGILAYLIRARLSSRGTPKLMDRRTSSKVEW